MTQNVTIALIQCDTVLGDKKKNIEKARELIPKAAEQGAQIVVLPELFLTGYDLGERYLKVAEKADGPSMQEFCRMAKDNSVYLQVGYVEEREIPGVIYNSVAFISPKGNMLGSYAKTHLFAGERMFFSCGDDMPVYETEYGAFASIICYDIGFPELSRVFALKGAQCLLVSAAWGDFDEDIWDNNLIARSTDYLMYMAACNRQGIENGTLHLIGKSKFMAPRGHVIKEAKKDADEILVATLDLSTIREERHRCLYFLDRRPELYELLAQKEGDRKSVV